MKMLLNKPVKIKSNKVKNQKKTPKLEHGKMKKNNPIRPTLVIGILGCMVVLLRLELGNYFEAGSDFMENDMLLNLKKTVGVKSARTLSTGGRRHSH